MRHDAETVVIDPAIDNHRAIAFYEKLGFERVGVREFGDDECLVEPRGALVEAEAGPMASCASSTGRYA